MSTPTPRRQKANLRQSTEKNRTGVRRGRGAQSTTRKAKRPVKRQQYAIVAIGEGY